MKAKPDRQEVSRKVDKYWVPIIARTIELLDCFGSATESLTLEEVVKRTGIPHTTAYRILHTLVLRDYLTQSGRQYRLNRLRRRLRFGFANLSKHICIAVEIQRSLEKATAGDRARTLVVYCLADCWMSWNAAKRALALGYTDVAWYPEGTDGWIAIGLPLQDATPEPRPDQ